MQKLIITLILFISGILVSIAQEKTHDLKVEIIGMKNDNGQVFIALYNTEKSFLKKPYKGTIAKIKDKKATAILKNIPKGIYAVSVFHDENNNQKLDTRIFGIPKEPYGCSNGASGFMGPPKYEDAKFTLNKNKQIVIKVN